MVREVRVWGLALGLIGLLTSHALAKTSGPDPTLVNPVGLGLNYTGPVRAGLGIVRTGPAYGFKAGEFVIQPRFLFENEFSSNFFKVDVRNEDVEETPGFSFHLRPGVGIHNPNATSVKMHFATDVDVLLPTSDDDRVTDQTNVGLVVDAGATFTLRRVLSFTLKDKFRRELLVRPLSAAGGDSNRNVNSLGSDISFHPGGGALVFELGYKWDMAIYDSLNGLDDSTHNFRFLTSWKFLPLNFAFLETTLGVKGYSEDQTDVADAKDVRKSVLEATLPGNRNEATPFKIYAGFSGYLTNKISLTLRAGYGNSFLENSEDFSSFIGDVRLSFRFSGRTVLHVGGGRNFNIASLGGFTDTTRSFVSFEQSFADVVLLHADVGFNYMKYGAWSPADVFDEAPTEGLGGPNFRTCTRVVLDGEEESEEDICVNLDESAGPVGSKRQVNREDFMLNAGLLADFEISRIFGLSIGYRFVADITDFGIESQTYEVDSGDETEWLNPKDPLNPTTVFQGYMDHRVFLTLNLRY